MGKDINWKTAGLKPLEDGKVALVLVADEAKCDHIVGVGIFRVTIEPAFNKIRYIPASDKVIASRLSKEDKFKYCPDCGEKL